MILDHYDDEGSLLLDSNELQKVASAEITDIFSGMIQVNKQDRVLFPDEEFALLHKEGMDYNRYFPMPDYGNTVLSITYFLSTGGMLPDTVKTLVAGRLAERARQLGMKHEADVLSEFGGPAAPQAPVSFEPQGVQPPQQEQEALNIRGNQVPVFTGEQKETVASLLDDDIHKYSPHERRSIALQCVVRDVPMGDRLSKYASLDENPSRNFWMGKRWEMLGERQGDAASEIHDILQEGDLEKKAFMLDEFDRNWGPFAKVPDAFLTVFKNTPVVDVPADTLIPEDSLDKLASMLGEDVRAAIRDNGLSSLDEETRGLVETILADNGESISV